MDEPTYMLSVKTRRWYEFPEGADSEFPEGREAGRALGEGADELTDWKGGEDSTFPFRGSIEPAVKN